MQANEADLSGAREPGRLELMLRKNLLWQAIRFAVLNLKMIKMITKGHTPNH